MVGSSKFHSNSTSFHSVHIGGVGQWSDELDRDIARVESLHGSIPSTHVDPDGYESPTVTSTLLVVRFFSAGRSYLLLPGLRLFGWAPS
jgi:hypothetical protein